MNEARGAIDWVKDQGPNAAAATTAVLIAALLSAQGDVRGGELEVCAYRRLYV